MTICQENLYHAQKFKKQANDKSVKHSSYAFSDQIWLNNKYIKTKCHQKLKAKFFGLFWVLYPLGK